MIDSSDKVIINDFQGYEKNNKDLFIQFMIDANTKNCVILRVFNVRKAVMQCVAT